MPFALFAENGGTPIGITATLVSAFTLLLTGALWLLKYLLTTTIPEERRASAASFVTQAAAFEAALKTVVGEMAGLRGQFDERQTALLAHCEAEADKERQGSERRYQFALARMEQVQGHLQEHGNLLRGLMQVLQQRTRTADIVEYAEDPVWSKTLDGIITSWNRAAERLLGWRPTEAVGQSVYKFIPGDLHGQERDTLERVRKGEVVTQYRTARLHKDGHRIDLEVTVSPIADQAGKVVGVSSIARET